MDELTDAANSPKSLNLKSDELEELFIENDQSRSHRCRVCTVISSEKSAVYLCYVCDSYFCHECFTHHDTTHEFVDKTGESHIREKNVRSYLEKARGFRMRDEIAISFNFSDRLKVKCEFDQVDCDINSFCGMGNKRWVALDVNNQCLKIYDYINNSLLRYIRFGSKPWSVTEIRTGPRGESVELGNYSELAQNNGSSNTELLAVSFPFLKQIWLLDVDKQPATKSRCIPMEKKCFHIDFDCDKIYTLCRENEDTDAYSVHILGLDGNTLDIIGLQSSSQGYIFDIAVSHGKILLANTYGSRVFCINEDDKVVSYIRIEGSEPLGISVDTNGNIYVCASAHDIIYQSDSLFHGLAPIPFNKDFTQQPYRVGIHRDKLYISHLEPSLHNSVTVIQIT